MATTLGDYCECYLDVNGNDKFCDSCRDSKNDGSCGCCDAIIERCKASQVGGESMKRLSGASRDAKVHIGLTITLVALLGYVLARQIEK